MQTRERVIEPLLRRLQLARHALREPAPVVFGPLNDHGTLVTGPSVGVAMLRAMCFEHRARKAWEVQALGLPGKPLLPEFEASASAAADVYGDMLVHHYARRLVERDPLALVDDLSVVTV